MRELKTISEYQLLYLARLELERRIEELNCGSEISRRYKAHLKMFEEQKNEIDERMEEIRKEMEEKK